MGLLTAAAVANAYQVFAHHKIGRTLDVCRCPVCFGDGTVIEARLVRTPLREVTSADLSEYTNSAHGWGDDMLYLLPRYLDLIAQGEPPHHYGGIEYALSRLQHTPWRDTWPAAERDALDGFFVALFTEALHNRDLLDYSNAGALRGSEVSGIVICVANTGGGVQALLDVFDREPGLVPSLHLAGLVLGARTALFSGLLGWELLNCAEPVIAAWLLRPEVALRLENAFFDVTDPVDAAALSAGAQVVWGS